MYKNCLPEITVLIKVKEKQKSMLSESWPSDFGDGLWILRRDI